MLEDLKDVKSTVEYLLKNFPETRDDDSLLQLAVINIKCKLRKRIGDDAYKILKEVLLNEAPKLESIRRVRAKFQEDGLYQGTLREQKKEEAKKVKDYLKTL